MNRCALTEFCRLVPLEADETRQRFMELAVVLAVIRAFRGAHVRVMRGGSESIAEYDRALTIDPTLSPSLYGRGIAKHRKGDKSGGDADIEVALKAHPEVAGEFDEYGVQP